MCTTLSLSQTHTHTFAVLRTYACVYAVSTQNTEHAPPGSSTRVRARLEDTEALTDAATDSTDASPLPFCFFEGLGFRVPGFPGFIGQPILALFFWEGGGRVEFSDVGSRVYG